MSLTPKNWNTFQHYKDRSPAWVKLHKGLLTDFKFARLPIASKALAPLLWLLASEYEDGKITASLEEISFRVSIPEDQLRKALKPLIDGGFFIDDSDLLAACKRDAIPEKETEEQDKTETDIRTVASATRPANDDFQKFKAEYPKRGASNPWQPALKLFIAAVRRGEDPESIIRAAGLYRVECDTNHTTGTDKVAQAQTWLRQERWKDYLAGAYAVTDQPSEKHIQDMAARGWEWRENKWQQKLTNQGEAA